jgi:hypothetical protein
MNYRIELKNVKKGMVFFEYDMGMTAEVTALEDAHPSERGENNPGIGCMVQVTGDKKPTEFWEADFAPSHYRLKLYTENPYVFSER